MTKMTTMAAALLAVPGLAMLPCVALAQTAPPQIPQSVIEAGPVGMSGMSGLTEAPPAPNPATVQFMEGMSGMAGSAAVTAPDVDTAAVEQVDGLWMNAEGIPTYKIDPDGTVDFATFSGFRRYHAECHVCHGPDGEGSSYAPALKDSVMNMDYYDFLQVVASGREVVGGGKTNVMPMLGTNKNVMCYLDDIYVYLRARGTDAIPRGRPAKKAPKSDELAAKEASCME